MPLEALDWDLTPAGLHYVLIHYDIPSIDPTTWELQVNGVVRSPRALTLGDLRGLTRHSRTLTMECAGNGRAGLHPRPVSQPWITEAVGTATWSGARLADVLDLVDPDKSAVEIVFTGVDRGLESKVEQNYQRSLPIASDAVGDALIAYEMNDEPLLPQHGAPARLVVPGWYGMTNVKWLESITAITEPFQGHQQTEAYRVKTDDGDEGRPVTKILPRSLMRPPGIPDFMSRHRVLAPGTTELRGRAWSGNGPIVRIEVSTDDGLAWYEADVDPAPDPFAWHSWRCTWMAEHGEHVLVSRATDSTGSIQPLAAVWNTGGYEVNEVHRGPVTVR